MKIRGFKRILAGAAAASALAMGAGVLAPAVVSAAPEGVNVTQAAARYKGPKLGMSQGDFGGGRNMNFTIDNPNGGASSCSSVVLDGELGMKALIAYADEDYVELVRIALLENGTRLGPATAWPFTESGKRALKLDDGVYVYLGTCGGLDTAINPTSVGVSLAPVIVPSGIGSVEPALNYGSLAGQSLPALIKILPELMTGS